MSFMSFGEKIKRRREEMSLTQEDVSSYICEELKKEDFSRQAISKWECDEAYPVVKILLILSVKLGMSLDELFSDELANLRRNEENKLSKLDRYPGLFAGIKTFAEILKKMDL